MNRMVLKRIKSGSGHRSSKRMGVMLSFLLLLVLPLGACGSSSWERLRASGTLSNGEVILGESGNSPGPAYSSDPAEGSADLIASESVPSPTDSTRSILPENGLNQAPGDSVQLGDTDAASSAMPAAATPTPTAQTVPQAGVRPTPLPDAPATPEPKMASTDAGILVRSENILSTSEKEALLNELERELNGLFGAIDQVSTEQQASQAE